MTEVPEPALVKVARTVVERHSYRHIHNVTGEEVKEGDENAVLLDAMSAQLIMTSWNQLVNKQLMQIAIDRVGPVYMIHKLWGMVGA